MNCNGLCLSSSDFSDRIDASKRNRGHNLLLSLPDLQQTTSLEARVGWATVTAWWHILGKREQSEVVTTISKKDFWNHSAEAEIMIFIISHKPAYNLALDLDRYRLLHSVKDGGYSVYQIQGIPLPMILGKITSESFDCLPYRSTVIDWYMISDLISWILQSEIPLGNSLGETLPGSEEDIFIHGPY